MLKRWLPSLKQDSGQAVLRAYTVPESYPDAHLRARLVAAAERSLLPDDAQDHELDMIEWGQ